MLLALWYDTTMYSMEPDGTTLLLVRHAETTWNSQRRYAGHSEVPLSPDADQQIAQLTQRLAHESIQAIYSSPLSRCIATIYPTAEVHGLSINLELGLRERNLGQWEGVTETEIRQNHPQFTFPISAYDGEYAVPEGETLDALAFRTHTVLQRIAERQAGRNTLVATHAGIIWMVLTRIVTNSPEVLDWPHNTTILRLSYHDTEFRLLDAEL